MPVFRAKILVPQFIAVEAASIDEARPALMHHTTLKQGVLLEIERIPPVTIEPVPTPPAGQAA